jgi:ribosomal protein L37AE/L43A
MAGEYTPRDLRDPDARERLRYERRMARGGRRYPCPTCGRPAALSAREKAKGYQCSRCADRAEGLCGW